jgi:hypothetical protein
VERAYLLVDSVALHWRCWHRVGCPFVTPEAGQNHTIYFFTVCLSGFLTPDHNDLLKFVGNH